MRRLAVLLVLGLAGCVTPSIPIPPPDPTQMTFEVTPVDGTEDTEATFRYPANVNYEDAVVFIYNRSRGIGIIEAAREDGSVGPTAPVSASIGEQIDVTFQRDDQAVSTCIRLREGSQDPTAYCDR